MERTISMLRNWSLAQPRGMGAAGTLSAAGCGAASLGNRIAVPAPASGQCRYQSAKGAAGKKGAQKGKGPVAPPVQPIPQLPVPAETAPELVNMGIRRTLDLEHRIRFDPDGRSMLFARRSAKALTPGSMVAVETAASVSNPTRSIIIGYIVAIRRKGGMGSNFVVRTTVMGTGVEVMFPVYSPLVTKIEVLQRSEEFQRSKLYYLKSAEPRSLASETFKRMDQRVEEFKKRYILADRSKINMVK